MRRSLDVYLWEVRKQAMIVLEFTEGRSFAGYQSDKLLRLAVERVFTILGEALVRVRKHFPDDFRHLIDAGAIVTFRNQLVHLYDQTSDEEVWGMVTQSLPQMVIQPNTMLVEQEP
jgi:uncharacterized protein with HEPN domain